MKSDPKYGEGALTLEQRNSIFQGPDPEHSALASGGGHKGVSFNKRLQKWAAYISDGSKKLHLGVFEKPGDAADAYAKAARELHGDFANLG